jgi:hypothetical protein
MTQIAIRIAEQNSIDVLKIVRRSPVCNNPEAVRTVTDWWEASDKVWAGMVDGEIACLWGLAPPTFLSTSAYLWLCTTNLVEEHKFLFIRYSQRYVEQMLEIYPEIIGHTATDNLQAIRWIRWLGGEYAPPLAGYRAFTIRRP